MTVSHKIQSIQKHTSRGTRNWYKVIALASDCSEPKQKTVISASDGGKLNPRALSRVFFLRKNSAIRVLAIQLIPAREHFVNSSKCECLPDSANSSDDQGHHHCSVRHCFPFFLSPSFEVVQSHGSCCESLIDRHRPSKNKAPCQMTHVCNGSRSMF